MAHLPQNELRELEFNNIKAYEVSFENSIPDLIYGDASVNMGNRVQNESEWKSAYSYEYDTVLGYIEYENNRLSVVGYDSSAPNIYYVGLNLTYLAQEIDRSDMWEVIDDIVGFKQGQTPVRQLVPIDIEVADDKITIHCDEENVNTTLAWQDNFVSKQNIYSVNNMLYISEKDTAIEIIYPKFTAALLVSFIGLALCVAVWLLEGARIPGRTAVTAKEPPEK